MKKIIIYIITIFLLNTCPVFAKIRTDTYSKDCVSFLEYCGIVENAEEKWGIDSPIKRRDAFSTVVTVKSPLQSFDMLYDREPLEMLKSDYGSITNIAQTLGFLDIYDFSRAFKKYVGISPLKYKKQLHIQ